jgi:hypothetical protein
LEYGDAPKEFQKAGPLNHKINLLPIDGDWNKCWRDTGIVATVPYFPESGIQIVGNLILWKPGVILTHPVQISRGGPGINYFVTAPEYNDRVNRYGASSGGTITVYGIGFGNQPGKIYLELTNPIGGQKQVFLTPTSWADNNIVADIPKVPGSYPSQTARLFALNTQLNRYSDTSIQFGPKMIYTLISGKDFLELAHPAKQPQNDRAEEESGTLLVTHDPECGPVIGSGNEGVDKFFTKNKPLPPNVEIVYAIYAQIDPLDEWGALKWFAKQMNDAASEFGLIKKFGEVLAFGIGSFFDPSVGKYEVSCNTSAANQPFLIFWWNTCQGMSPFNGVPIKYIMGFKLWGPEGIVPGSPVN